MDYIIQQDHIRQQIRSECLEAGIQNWKLVDTALVHWKEVYRNQVIRFRDVRGNIYNAGVSTK